jgi:hypothetical protein
LAKFRRSYPQSLKIQRCGFAAATDVADQALPHFGMRLFHGRA